MPDHAPASVIFSTGRGWEIFEHETDLEPDMPRFDQSGREVRLVDDARIPNRLTGIFRTAETPLTARPPDRQIPAFPLSNPPQSRGNTRIATLLAHFPDALSIKSPTFKQLVQSLVYSTDWIGFEVVGNQSEIAYQVSCAEVDITSVHSQLRNHLPDIDFRRSADKLIGSFRNGEQSELVEMDIGLKNSWILAIADPAERGSDPTVPLIAVLDALAHDDALCLQVLISRTRRPWAGRASAELFDRHGKLVFKELREQTARIKEKIRELLVAVRIRAVAKSSTRQRSIELVRKTGAHFKQFAAADSNEFIPLAGSMTRAPGSILRSLIARTSFRSGMLLSTREASLMARFPVGEIRSEKLTRVDRATKRAPVIATSGTIILGENEHAGETQKVRVSPAYHGLVIGGTGTGKSTLLLNSVLQSVALGGCCVVDPHGDLVDDIIARLPEDRLEDTILFDPSDADYPIGFNVLEANSETEKTFLASDMVATFRRYSSSWGDVMDAVLSNAILAFVETSRGGTLFDLKRFLVEKDFRREFLDTIDDEAVRYFWLNEFPIISGRTQSSVLIRLDSFLRQKLVRNVVCQSGSKLVLREIIDNRKILLIKLSQGLLGEENAWLLGTLLISKIYGIALTRGDVSKDERPLWPVVIDEAAHFSGIPTMSLILENLRKFGISLTLSTQSYKLLMTKVPAVADSALTNCQIRICFRLGDNDAERLASGFSSFDARALQNLGTGQAIMRIERSENDFNLKTFPAEPVPPEIAKRRLSAVIENTRKKYSTPVEEVEAQFRSLYASTRTKNQRISTSRSEIRLSESPSKLQQSTSQDDTLKPIRAKPPAEGRGGAHHKEMQAVIKRMAEMHGFEARIEESVLEGAGGVDVSLENESLKIACEVSVTTTDYETHNVQKCLAAGYDHVLVVVSNKKKIPLLNAKIDKEISSALAGRVKVLSLNDLLAFLKEMGNPVSGPLKRTRRSGGNRIGFTEACDLLEKSPTTLYRWVREGRVPYYRVGREYEFDRDELLLLGRQDPLSKRRSKVSLTPLSIEKNSPKTKKQQDDRYRKLLKLDKMDGPLHTRREKEAHDN